MPSPLVNSSQPCKDHTQALEEKQHHKPGRPAESVGGPVLPSAAPPCPTTSPIPVGSSPPASSPIQDSDSDGPAQLVPMYTPLFSPLYHFLSIMDTPAT